MNEDVGREHGGEDKARENSVKEVREWVRQKGEKDIREKKRVGGKGLALPWKLELSADSVFHSFPTHQHPSPVSLPVCSSFRHLSLFSALLVDHTRSHLSLPLLPPASLARDINHTLVPSHLTQSSHICSVSTHSRSHFAPPSAARSLFFSPFFFFLFFLPRSLPLNTQLFAKSLKEAAE